jgi:hypothetical protein
LISIEKLNAIIHKQLFEVASDSGLIFVNKDDKDSEDIINDTNISDTRMRFYRYLGSIVDQSVYKGLEREEAYKYVSDMIKYYTEKKLIPTLSGDPTDDEIDQWLAMAITNNIGADMIDRL